MNMLHTLLAHKMVRDGRAAAALILLISVGLIAGAYTFQYVWHYLPCELCYWQRKPHFILMVLAPVALLWRPMRPYVLGLMGLVALANMGIAIFHVGVEEHWWAGLSTCSSPASNGITSFEELKRQMQSGVQLVPCDRAVWWFLGLSMAAWNGVASLVQAAIAFIGGTIAWRNRAR